MPPSLSVIIVTHNAEAFIADCLRSVAAQQCDVPAEVVVVDNASTDATLEAVRAAAAGARILPAGANLGFAAANNIGIRQSDAELILLLNPDTRMHPGALDALVRALRDTSGAGVAGPRLLNADGTLQRTGNAFPSLWNTAVEILGLDKLFPRSRLFGRHRRLYLDPELPARADYLQGSCLLIRRAVFEKAGLLDERFFLYFEETDFCRRVRDAGWSVVYVPGAVVTHLGGGGAAAYSGERLCDYHRSFLLYLQKHETPVRRACMRALLAVRAVVRAAALRFLSLVRTDGSATYLDRSRGYWQSAGIVAGWNRR